MEQLKMTFEKHRATRTPVTRERLSQVCKLVNAGLTPVEVCNELKFSKHYFSMMQKCGLISVDESGNYKAMERIHNERYAMFLKLKQDYSKGIRTESARVEKFKKLVDRNNSVHKPERNFIQRIIAKIFNL